MKYGEVMNVVFDSKAKEYKAVEAVKSAYLNMTKAKLRFAFQCARLREVNSDALVYGMKYADFMRKYFGLTKSSASEYATAGTMVVYEKGTYHSKFVSLDAVKFGDFTVSALLIAAKNEEAFREAFNADCFTVFSSVANIKKALKNAEAEAEAEATEAEAEATEAEAEATEAEAEAEATEAEAEATEAKVARYDAYDVLRYHEAVRALETACASNEAAIKALKDLQAVIEAMTGLK